MGVMEIDSPHPQGIYSFWKSFLQPLTFAPKRFCVNNFKLIDIVSL